MKQRRSIVGLTGLATAMACILCAPVLHAAEAGTTEKSRDEVRKELDAAQKRLDEAAREVATLSMSMSGDMEEHLSMAFPKAVLGLTVPAGRRDTRDDGAEVLSVSPGGGAAEAGLRAGDILTEINGKPMKRSGEKGPGDQVRATMREVNPEQKVSVRYLRDGKPATATVTAKAPSPRTFNFHTAPVAAARAIGPFQHFAFMRAGGLFGDAELVALTPKLGQYFGTDKGLLVVRAPGDARLKLEEGDVILDVDGRVPSSPSHALQILTSYESGEKLKLNVLRMKKRMTIDVTVPEGRHERWERAIPAVPPEDVLIPAPSAAPLPPGVPGTAAVPHVRREIRVVRPGDETV